MSHVNSDDYYVVLGGNPEKEPGQDSVPSPDLESITLPVGVHNSPKQQTCPDLPKEQSRGLVAVSLAARVSKNNPPAPPFPHKCATQAFRAAAATPR